MDKLILPDAAGPGLPSELLDRPRGVGIAMAAGLHSLNVATTSGIVLPNPLVRRAAR